jgi:hypothetical protein
MPGEKKISGAPQAGLKFNRLAAKSVSDGEKSPGSDAISVANPKARKNAIEPSRSAEIAAPGLATAGVPSLDDIEATRGFENKVALARLRRQAIQDKRADPAKGTARGQAAPVPSLKDIDSAASFEEKVRLARLRRQAHTSGDKHRDGSKIIALSGRKAAVDGAVVATPPTDKGGAKPRSIVSSLTGDRRRRVAAAILLPLLLIGVSVASGRMFLTDEGTEPVVAAAEVPATAPEVETPGQPIPQPTAAPTQVADLGVQKPEIFQFSLRQVVFSAPRAELPGLPGRSASVPAPRIIRMTQPYLEPAPYLDSRPPNAQVAVAQDSTPAPVRPPSAQVQMASLGGMPSQFPSVGLSRMMHDALATTHEPQARLVQPTSGKIPGLDLFSAPNWSGVKHPADRMVAPEVLTNVAGQRVLPVLEQPMPFSGDGLYSMADERGQTGGLAIASRSIYVARAEDLAEIGPVREPVRTLDSSLPAPQSNLRPEPERVAVAVFAPIGTAEARIEELRATLGDFGYEIYPTMRVDLTISQDQIRYYFDQDADAARALAITANAAVRDFSYFRPSPDVGLLEIWLSGFGVQDGDQLPPTPPEFALIPNDKPGQ